VIIVRRVALVVATADNRPIKGEIKNQVTSEGSQLILIKEFLSPSGYAFPVAWKLRVADEARSPIQAHQIESSAIQGIPCRFGLARIYEFVAPLDAQGHIDSTLWKEQREHCRVRRFWNEDDEQTNVLFSKRLGLLREIVPKAEAFAFLVNPNYPNAEPDTKEMRAAAAAANRRLEVLGAGSESELETAFTAMRRRQVGGVIVGVDPQFFMTVRTQLAALEIRYRIPSIYNSREFPAAGGLMSYGTDQLAPYRQAGVYVGRILQGEKPADLPVQFPTKFEFNINLRTAKALGLEIPPGVLAIVDEVIE
jgi:ABC transporter substrate binding protein